MKSIIASFSLLYLCLFSASYAVEEQRDPTIFGPWHKANFVQVDAHQFGLANPDRIFGGNSPFDSFRWKHAAELNQKPPMLFRFIKDYKLIGMDRSRVHLLLGPSEAVSKDGSPDKQTADQEWYGILFDCTLSGHFLELAYEKDKVVAFRSVSGKSRDVLTKVQRKK